MRLNRMNRISQAAMMAGLISALSACTAAKLPDDPVGNGSKAYGLSPTSVQLEWEALKTAESYRIFNSRTGTTPVYTTTFPEATLSGLTKGTDYTFSVRGVRGTSGRLSDPLDTWSFRTWADFSAVTFTTSLQPNGDTQLLWNYRPFDSGVQAAADALMGSDISCSFLPVAAGTDPLQVDPSVASGGNNPVVLEGPLFAQSMTVRPGQIDSSKTYAVQCRAKYVDGTSSVSPNHFLFSPVHSVAACSSVATVGSAYNCTPNVTAASLAMTPLGPYRITVHPSNTCPWAGSLAPNTSITGTPGAGHVGTCNLVYTYTLTSLTPNYVSPLISTTVTVSAPEAYTVFPSFAVRAASGAVSYPKFYKLATAPMDPLLLPARIKGDLITDFGQGSSFFAGGSDPFPEINTAAPPIPSSSLFYGFPTSALVMGVRPNGFSLDAIRPVPGSTDPATEGFIRGSLVVPQASVSNATFLNLTGRVAPISLYNFLTNTYTFDGGSNYSPVSLSYYLRTTVDFPVSGIPVTNNYNGIALERGTVTINPPTQQVIESYIPSSGGSGSFRPFLNADPLKLDPQGLVTVSPSTLDFYVTNCQVNPTGAGSTDPLNPYPNPLACGAVPAPPRQVHCYGDVIVQGPLLLVDATILTDDEGCRIYATGTVFIQGSLKAVKSVAATSAEAPLQIASSRAVIVGFSQQSLGTLNGTRTNSGVGLIDQNFANGTTNPFLTRHADNAGSASAALNAIARDAQIVSLKLLDASNNYAVGPHAFKYLALSGPYLFSNYSGMLTGAVIADVALFPQLNFTADPDMKGLAPFPLLKNADVPVKVAP